jgi:Ca2+-binding EF-hand superfamily protein
MLAYGQQPQDNPKQPQQGQPQSQTPTDAPKQPQTAEQVFAALDSNHDGKLSQEEFAKLFRDAKVSDVQEEFARWDKNGDKSLTMDEFKAGYSQR